MPLQYNQGYTTGGGVGGAFTPMMGESWISRPYTYGVPVSSSPGLMGGAGMSAGSDPLTLAEGTTAGDYGQTHPGWQVERAGRTKDWTWSHSKQTWVPPGKRGVAGQNAQPSPAAPPPSSLQGLQAAGGGGGASSNVSGGEGMSAPGEGGEQIELTQLSGPNPLRQGIGQRLLPTQSAALAGLRRAY